MSKYVNIIYKYKTILKVILVVSIILSIIGIFKMKMNTDFALFSTNNSKYQARLDDLNDSFGNLDQIIVVVEHDDFTLSEQTDLYNIQRKLETVNEVLQIQGVAPLNVNVNGSITPFLSTSTELLETYYSSFAEFSPLVLLDGTYYSTFTIFIGESFNTQEVNEIENLLDEYSFDYYITGDTYSQSKISEYILKILLILPPLTLLTILVVFRWQMKAIKPTLFSVIPAGIGSLWTFGLVGWLGNEVSILTAVVPIFIIVIGSADGLHFMSHYQDSKLEKLDTKTALKKTLTIVGIPMIVTTLTSMVGFLSLLSMKTDSIYDLAVFGAVGILLAGFATWIVLPLILSHEINVLPKKIKPSKFNIERPFKALRGVPSFIIIILIFTVASFTIRNINNEFSLLMVYKDSTEVATNASKVQEINGGSIPFFVSIDLGDDPISLEEKNLIDLYAQELMELDEVTKVINPYRIFDIMFQQQASGEIPNDQILENMYNQLKLDDTNTIHNLINQEDNKVRLLVFSTDLDNQTLQTIEDYTNTKENMSITGVQFLLMELNTSIGMMQLNSIILAIGLVMLMLLFTLRNIKVAVISILPILITVLALYGFLGLSGIPLNITTVMIFSITIGVGIDYAVHFSSVYQYYKKLGHTSNEAVDFSFKNSSRPIITNALGISLGLSIMMLSPLTIHLNVSILMWVSMIVSVFVTLTFLPTILAKLKE